MDTIEKKSETLQDFCKTICEELDFIKSTSNLQQDAEIFLNYHKADDNNINNNQEYLPNVPHLFKTVIVSGRVNSIHHDAVTNIQTYENEDLDDVHDVQDGHSYEDLDYEETVTTTTTGGVFEALGDFEEVIIYIEKIGELDDPPYDNLDSESRVEELENINEEIHNTETPLEEYIEKETEAEAEAEAETETESETETEKET